MMNSKVALCRNLFYRNSIERSVFELVDGYGVHYYWRFVYRNFGSEVDCVLTCSVPEITSFCGVPFDYFTCPTVESSVDLMERVGVTVFRLASL